MTKWTDNQRKAITLDGGNILVSAAAGSGKTAVMIERIFGLCTGLMPDGREYCDRPIDGSQTSDINDSYTPAPKCSISNMVIVTFTNAAAASMKKKLAERFDKAIELYGRYIENDKSITSASSAQLEAAAKRVEAYENLIKERSLIDGADISTIHSYCIKLLRRYYFATSLPPEFRIITKSEAEAILHEAIDEVIEDACARYAAGTFPEYGELYKKVVKNKKNDDNLVKAIANLVSILDNTVNKNQLKQVALCANKTSCENTLLNELKKNLTIYLEALNSLAENYKDIDRPLMDYVAALNEQVNTMLNSNTLAEARSNQFRKKSKPKNSVYYDEFNEIHSTFIKLLDDRKIYFAEYSYGDNDAALHALFELAESVIKKRDILYAEKGGISIAIVIRYALDMLTSDEKIKADIKSDISYIFVDEYQDTNVMQDAFVNMLSNGENLFFVGDVKQSIYLFQNACPELFINKLRECNGSLCTLVQLQNNFRSLPGILKGINYIFENIMHEKYNSIEYSADALRPSPDDGYFLNNTVLTCNGETESANELLLLNAGTGSLIVYRTVKDVYAAEAESIAKRILDILGSTYTDANNEAHTITYRDIAILCRKNKDLKFSDYLANEFKKYGIPFSCESAPDKRFSASGVLLAMLKLLQNKQRDIELIAVLSTCIGGFTYNELAQIRSECNNKESFYTALKGCSDVKLKEKADIFFKKLSKYRLLQKTMPLADFIEFVYTDSGYIYDVANMDEGLQQLEAVNRFIFTARSYESNSDGGLSGFIKYAERLGDDIDVSPVSDGNENAVRFLTMHKSKGLEFPVVILAFTNMSLFTSNNKDAPRIIADNSITGENCGVELYDSNSKSITKKAIELKKKNAERNEFLRLLYVAMTRAQYKLIVSAAVYTANKSIYRSGNLISLQYNSFAEIILPLLARHKNCKAQLEKFFGGLSFDYIKTDSDWSVRLVTASDLKYNAMPATAEISAEATSPSENSKAENAPSVLSEASPVSEAPALSEATALSEAEAKRLSEAVEKIVHWEYKYADATTQRTKQNPSKQHAHTKQMLRKPCFEVTDREFTGAQKGTIVHLFMEHAVFDGTPALNQAQQMLASGLITQKEYDTLPFAEIDNFLKSEIGIRLKNAELICRESPFCKIVTVNAAGDTSLVQGIIDCYFFEKGSNEIILLDYKTDIIIDSLQARVEYHKPQMMMYKEALEKLYPGKTVVPYLHFFTANQTVRL